MSEAQEEGLEVAAGLPDAGPGEGQTLS